MDEEDFSGEATGKGGEENKDFREHDLIGITGSAKQHRLWHSSLLFYLAEQF